MITVEEELHRKALDQIAGLEASYEAGRITAQSFRIGVETVWGCLGGMVKSRDFEDLMRAANALVRELPDAPLIRVLVKDDHGIITVRKHEKIAVYTIEKMSPRMAHEYPVDDEAIAHVARFADAVSGRDFKDITA